MKLIFFIAAFLLVSLPAFGAAPVTQIATVRLDWTDNSDNETNFNIYRCQGTNAVPTCVPTAKIASVGSDVVTWSDTILNDPGNTPFCYAVDASNVTGFSAKVTGCGRTAAIIVVGTKPGAPTGIKMTIVGVTIP